MAMMDIMKLTLLFLLNAHLCQHLCLSQAETDNGNRTAERTTTNEIIVNDTVSPPPNHTHENSVTDNLLKNTQSYTVTNVSVENITRTSTETEDDHTTVSSTLEDQEDPDLSQSQNQTSPIEVVFLSPTSGFIQTVNWQNRTGPGYGSNLEVWAEVDVPADHDVMLSFTDLDVEGDSLGKCKWVGDSVSLFLGNSSQSNLVWKACDTKRPPAGLHTTDKVLVRFLTDVGDPSRGPLMGFRLHFSFHNVSGPLPERLSDGTWNCSVPHWPDFERHLQCNLEAECWDGRDEAVPCPHYSQRCGAGRFEAGGQCFLFVNLRKITPWMEAQRACHAKGGWLASLDSDEVWNEVIRILRTEWIHHVLIGLELSSFTLPDVYHNMHQWSDGTMAYYFRMEGWQDPSGCGVLQVGLNNILLDHFLRCQNGLPYPFLCRLDLQEEEDKESGYAPQLTGTETGTSSDLMGQETEVSRQVSGQDAESYSELTGQGSGSSSSQLTARQNTILLVAPEKWTSNASVVTCPEDHVTHTFLACDASSHCWGDVVDSVSRASSPSPPAVIPSSSRDGSCAAPLTPLPPAFTCSNGVQHVPYSLLCDHRRDCGDGSDEDFCVLPACDWLEEFDCGGKQCIPVDQVCDGHEQCVSGNDEEQCVRWRINYHFLSPPPPAVVTFDADLSLRITPFNESASILSPVDCPASHFLCPPRGYCLPVFLRCNGVNDCPDKADEEGCQSYKCPGFYRCRASKVCLHPDHLCDGVSQCPQNEDELLCGLSCPAYCQCHGWAFFCSLPFLPGDFPQLRFLDARGSGMSVTEFKTNSLLVSLNLADCGLTDLSGLVLPNLKTLDVRDNLLTTVRTSELGSVSSLNELLLAGNPLVSDIFITDTGPQLFALPSLTSLDLGRTVLTELDTTVLSMFPGLQILDLSDCGIQRVAQDGFGFLSELRVIDLRGSEVVYFPRDLLSGLSNLQRVYADNFKLCCPAILPDGFNVLNCHAPVDEISSCDSLLRSDFYRIVLFVLAALALAGNLGSFVMRSFFSPNKALGFAALVTHLCVSDFLMGVYLLVIGVADQVYRGEFLWRDMEWRHSAACKAAGFLSFLSSEVSGFIICLITFDRFVVLRFPFSRFRFTRRSAHVACACAWLIGVLLAAVPLLPAVSHWRFYSQTGICIPLPVTRQEFAGHGYSFGVMIVLNLALFVAIAAGQACIYWSIRVNSVASASRSKSPKDLAIARRLITIAASDFVCWFPIGVLGVLAWRGVPVPSEVGVGLAILALPLNSAINPFLYTLNILLERRRRAQEDRLRKRLESRMKSTSQAGRHGSTKVTSAADTD